MPTLKPTSSPSERLAQALGETGEEEYRRLHHVLEPMFGRFALIPVESDLDFSLRNILLERLRADLAESGRTLRVVRLTREAWDFAALVDAEPAYSADVTVLMGLEETPGLVLEPGAERRRPPA